MTSIGVRRLEPGDIAWLIQRHAELYARDEGFDATFEALVAEILADFIHLHDPARERAFVATRGTERLGSIFCVRQDAQTARVRLFLLEPEVRGTGLGWRLLQACMSYARTCGYRRMVLWTHASHKAACALYRKAGWICVSSRPVVSFGVELEEQAWELALDQSRERG